MAGTAALGLPAAAALAKDLVIVDIEPATLIRVTPFDSGKPYFGKSANYRFDDPNPVEAQRFGTCYAGQSLAMSMAESILHDAVQNPLTGQYDVPIGELQRRFAISFQGKPLKMANLTGSLLLRLGGTNALTGCADYDMPQRWSSAIFHHRNCVDGFVYVSRLLNDPRVFGLACVIYERGAAPNRITQKASVPLVAAAGFAHALQILGINPV